MDIDVPSAVEVFTTLRYINLHLLTYLLYLLLTGSSAGWLVLQHHGVHWKWRDGAAGGVY